MMSREAFILTLVYITNIITSIQATLLPSGRFRDDYTLTAGAGGWLRLHRVPADWHSARLHCYHEGAVLASPSRPELDAALRRLLEDAGLGRMQTGVHATHGAGLYASVEGVPLEKMSIQLNDAKTDNDNRKFQDCTMLTRDGLVDSSCEEYAPYACYRKAGVDELSVCGTVDAEYTMDAGTGHCYKFHDQPQTWSQAYLVCQAEGGHLAIVNSQYEAGIMVELFKKHPPQYTTYSSDAFIGMRKWGPSDTWWTIHGEMLKYSGYATWSEGQPNNYARNEIGFDTQLCGSISDNGGLNDMWCRQPLAFVCEKTRDSLFNVTTL